MNLDLEGCMVPGFYSKDFSKNGILLLVGRLHVDKINKLKATLVIIMCGPLSFCKKRDQITKLYPQYSSHT